MSRNIKFRAWDKAYSLLIEREDWANCLSGWMNAPEIFDVMQYTGLKDKNGVEIYEGDIVRRNGRLEGAMPVMFVGGGFRAHEMAGDARFDEFYHLNTGDNWEVIGNIHENPELLESK